MGKLEPLYGIEPSQRIGAWDAGFYGFDYQIIGVFEGIQMTAGFLVVRHSTKTVTRKRDEIGDAERIVYIAMRQGDLAARNAQLD